MSESIYAGRIKALAAATDTPVSLANPDRRVSVDNPFCGDRIDLEISTEDLRVTALAQEVRGCMLCQAAANVMASAAPGLSAAELEVVSQGLSDMLSGNKSANWPPEGWESLAAFEPVSRHKSRHGCVTLAFTAVLKALA